MSWAELELQSMDLGDVRLNRRAVKIADSLGLAPRLLLKLQPS